MKSHKGCSCSSYSVTVTDNQRWWGGASAQGLTMPLGNKPYHRDLGQPLPNPKEGGAPSNQVAPVFISTTGEWVYSDKPITCDVEGETITFTGSSLVHGVANSKTLGGAYEAIKDRVAVSDKVIDRRLVTQPQYNTWIEMPYKPRADKVIRYIDALLEAGMPAGTVFIDDMWSKDYGNWTFDPEAFPDPEGFLAALHERGCSVMLWLVPFVSPDSESFRNLNKAGLLVRDSTGEPAIRKWWNGYSGLVDLSHPDGVKWVTDRLDRLVEMGVDGFKFDGADIRDIKDGDLFHVDGFTNVDYCHAWSDLATRYSFNEMRACWNYPGPALAQRLADKPPTWDNGIKSLIPDMLTASMMGHTFLCPDMIGGGEISATGHGVKDPELYVRHAQIAAMSPMMQFSMSPVRALDEEHLAFVMDAMRIRESLGDYLSTLFDRAASEHLPMMLPMSFFGDVELAECTDQFYLGSDLIVAPVINKGETSRRVRLPKGTWKDDRGEQFTGPVTITAQTPLDRIPRYSRISK